jgi:pSer/pThr/pTyr-binding forkhead associated (FHA) protein
MVLDTQLQIREAGRPDRIVALRGVTTIGRDSSNDIVLESISISRFHAVLVREAAEWLLIDLASSNGTLVNGVPAPPDEAVRLGNGDELQFGQVLAWLLVGIVV